MSLRWQLILAAIRSAAPFVATLMILWPVRVSGPQVLLLVCAFLILFTFSAWNKVNLMGRIREGWKAATK